jgi:hypothetical protein
VREAEALAEDLAVVIGAEATRLFLARFAGCTIYVPAQAGPDHPITRTIGPEAAAELCAHYHRVRLDVPIAFSRRLRVLDLKRAGRSNQEIARDVWLTERQVRRILAEAATASSQLRLFE